MPPAPGSRPCPSPHPPKPSLLQYAHGTITFALGQFSTWTMLLAQTMTNLVLFPLSALLLVGLISVLFYLGRSLRRRPPHREEYYYR